MKALTIVLSAVGGLLELSGLVIVAREIAADRRRAREVFPRNPQVTRTPRTYPPKIMAPGPNPWAHLTPERPGELERQVGQGLATLANGIIETRKAMDTQLDRAVDELRHEAQRRDADVRDHLGYVLVGSIRQRVLGVILLGLGIVFGVAANVASVLH